MKKKQSGEWEKIVSRHHHSSVKKRVSPFCHGEKNGNVFYGKVENEKNRWKIILMSVAALCYVALIFQKRAHIQTILKAQQNTQMRYVRRFAWVSLLFFYDTKLHFMWAAPLVLLLYAVPIHKLLMAFDNYKTRCKYFTTSNTHILLCVFLLFFLLFFRESVLCFRYSHRVSFFCFRSFLQSLNLSWKIDWIRLEATLSTKPIQCTITNKCWIQGLILGYISIRNE